MDYKKMGILIREKRIEKKLTQKELADMLYITDRAVSKWERGISLPDITLLNKIIEILSIDVSELLGKDCSKVKKKTNKIIFPVLFFIIIILIILVGYNQKSFNSFCDKKLTKIYTGNNFTIYTNCISDVEINGASLKKILKNDTFNFDNWFSSLDYVGSYFDGGSIMYQAENYRVLKCKTIDSNNDIIVGNLNMEYESNFCKNNNSIFEKCFYSDFFKVVDILDNYKYDDSNYVFVILNQFQDVNLINVKIDKSFVSLLNEGNYYKFHFQYYLPNDYEIKDNYDIFAYYELTSITKSTLNGLEQYSENKCEKLVN